MPNMLGVTEWGGYAEYLKIAADQTFIIPDKVDFPTATIISRHAPFAFSLLRDEATGQFVPSDLELSLQAAAEGQYRVLIDRVLPLAEAAQAHRLVDERGGIGKVILQP